MSFPPLHGASSGCGGDGLQMRMVAANILKKQSWTADKGCPTVSHSKKKQFLSKC
jgi:hypothetical protein